MPIESSAQSPIQAPVPERLDALSPADGQSLLDAIVQSTVVRRRFEFFVWSQAQLQVLLPHGILLCGLPRGAGAGMFFEYFYNVPTPTRLLAELCQPRDGVASEWLALWRDRGNDPMAFTPHGGDGLMASTALERLGFDNAIVHGVHSDHVHPGALGFFAFVSLHRPPSPRDLQLAQLVVPHIFGAYSRALSGQPERDVSAEAKDGSTLSERELEILRWVRDGKSNQEIGMALEISPLTVKNHVQRILRKLQASNRAQAVAKAIGMKLLNTARRSDVERPAPDDDASLPALGGADDARGGRAA